MPMHVTCPTCAGALQVPRKLRGRTLFCPKCGQAIVITPEGVAQRGAGPTAAAPPGRNWAVLILLVLALVVGAGIAVGVVLLNQPGPGHKKPPPVARHAPDPTRGEAEPPGTQAGQQETPHPDRGTDPKPEPKKEPAGPDFVTTPPIKRGPVVLRGHTGPVYSVLFTRDGNTLISGGSSDNQGQNLTAAIKLWDVSSGRNTRTFGDSFPVVYSLALSPDGETLAASVPGGVIPLFDVATGKKRFTLGPVPESVINKAWRDINWNLAFSPDGKTVAAADMGGDLILWDVATRKNTGILSCTGASACLAVSPDGKTVAVGHSRGIDLWDVASGKIAATLTGHAITKAQTAYVFSVAFSPDGKTLASGGADSTVKLWDLASGQCTATLEGHSADVEIRSVAFSRDGKLLASAGGVYKNGPGMKGEIRVWEVAGGKEIRRFAQGTGMVWSVAFCPNGRLLASGSGDGAVKLWQVTGGDDHRLEVGDPVPAPRGKPVPFTGHTGPVYSVLFTRDGNTLISGGFQANKELTGEGEIKLWDVRTGRNTRTFEGPFPAIYSLALSPDGETLAASVYGGAVPLFDVATGKKRLTLEPVPESTITKVWRDYNWGVAFSPDGKTVAAANYGRMLILWDVATRKNTRNLDLATQSTWNKMGPGAGYCLAFSPDGKTLAGGDSFGINLWDVASGKLTANLTGDVIDPKTKLIDLKTNTVLSVAFSPDGKTLAWGRSDGTVKLWDLASGQCTATLKGHSADVVIRSVAFNRDGKRLASAAGVWENNDSGKKGEIRVWDVASGQVIHRFAQETGIVLSVAFSPNGRLLASGSSDGTVKLWDVAGNGAPAR
jgi:WD40 repeat protein